jgi:hypothetical protein
MHRSNVLYMGTTMLKHAHKNQNNRMDYDKYPGLMLDVASGVGTTQQAFVCLVTSCLVPQLRESEQEDICGVFMKHRIGYRFCPFVDDAINGATERTQREDPFYVRFLSNKANH